METLKKVITLSEYLDQFGGIKRTLQGKLKRGEKIDHIKEYKMSGRVWIMLKE